MVPVYSNYSLPMILRHRHHIMHGVWNGNTRARVYTMVPAVAYNYSLPKILRHRHHMALVTYIKYGWVILEWVKNYGTGGL